MGSCIAPNCGKVAVRVECAVHSWPALGTHQLARWLRLNGKDVKSVGSRKDVYSEHFRLEETTYTEVQAGKSILYMAYSAG